MPESPPTTVSSEQNVAQRAVAKEVPQPTEVETPPVDQPQESPVETVEVGWFRRGDQLVVGGLVIVAVVLMGVHWARLSGFGLEPIEIDRLPERQFDFQLEINSATWVEWMQLDGIGDTLARRIVADREENGPFAAIDDLDRVKGIGPKTVERIRPWLRFERREE